MKKIDGPLLKDVMNKAITSYGEKLVKMIVVLIAVIIFVLFLQVASFFGMFAWIEIKVRTLTGLDVMLVKGISFFILALFLGTPLLGYLWSFLPIPQKNKKRKRFIVLSVIGLFCFISFFASKEVYFNPKNGEPMKYYSVDVNGDYHFYSSEGYDPVTGDELKKVTKEVIFDHLGKDYDSGLENTQSYNFVDTKDSTDFILKGAERNSDFYTVTFKNKTGRNIYLSISFSSDRYDKIVSKMIKSNDVLFIKLMEGKHTFAYMDVNGSCYGEREGGKLLVKSGNTFYSTINNQRYYMDNAFSLDVIASEDQVVTLKENSVSLDGDLSDGNMHFLFFLGLIVCAGILLLIQPK